MSLRKKASRLIGKPVGVTRLDGTGVHGVLCKVSRKNIFLLVFIIDNIFSLDRIRLNEIKAIRKFPKYE